MKNIKDNNITAFDKGWEDAKQNSGLIGSCKNPYPYEDDSHDEWNDGWDAYISNETENTNNFYNLNKL